ncbi:C6 zinc finger domain-containing protein [Colletotrichum incanum]|nr:C6 zinc finger domain-containing protein [Colletotrichum incanum]
MSNSFMERANPPPRRKTCLACIKAKRRCDHGQPACLRCSRRKIDCVYPTPPTFRLEKRMATELLETPLSQGDSEMSTEAPASITEQAPCPDTSLTPWPQDADFFQLNITDLDGINLDTEFHEFLAADALLDGSLSLSSLTPRPEPMLVPPQGTAPEGLLEEMIASRIQYTLDEIKKVPTSTVLENQAPWSHPYLYRAHMPKEMQDAQACCALYIAKNSTNAPFVLRTIQARAHELLSSPIPKDRLNILARLQAALLYQIIRLFDGDISMRASAQQTLPALESTMLSLRPFVRWEHGQPEIGPAEDHSTCPTKETWHEWIFQESARRSIFFTCFLLVAYKLLVGKIPNGCVENHNICHSWTLSANLWKAPDVVDFAVAWREKRHFVVTKGSFNDVLRDAAADDIDVFGRMLIVGSMGIDEARLWFHNKGGSL